MIPTKNALEAFKYSDVDITITDTIIAKPKAFYAVSHTLFVWVDPQDTIKLADLSFLDGKTVSIACLDESLNWRLKLFYDRVITDCKPKEVTVINNTGYLKYSPATGKVFSMGELKI